MKTIEYYLNDAAKEFLDTNSFNEAIELLWRNEDIHWGIKKINQVVSKAMQEYAKQCCDEQIAACAENSKLKPVPNCTYKGVLKIIDKEAILNTPNVVTTK